MQLCCYRTWVAWKLSSYGQQMQEMVDYACVSWFIIQTAVCLCVCAYVRCQCSTAFTETCLSMTQTAEGCLVFYCIFLHIHYQTLTSSWDIKLNLVWKDCDVHSGHRIVRRHISTHLKFFDSSHPCASLIGTDRCQGFHFSPSRIVWESLDGKQRLLSVLCPVFSVTHCWLVLQTHCIGLHRAHFSVLPLISPAHFILLMTDDFWFHDVFYALYDDLQRKNALLQFELFSVSWTWNLPSKDVTLLLMLRLALKRCYIQKSTNTGLLMTVFIIMKPLFMLVAKWCNVRYLHHLAWE